MNEQFPPELLTQARAAESPETPEALLTLAAENGVTLTLYEAQAYFDRFHQTGELADEELDNVAGGCGQKAKENKSPMMTPYELCENFFVCKDCGSAEQPSHMCRGKEVTNQCHRCNYFSSSGAYGYCKRPERQRV